MSCSPVIDGCIPTTRVLRRRRSSYTALDRDADDDDDDSGREYCDNSRLSSPEGNHTDEVCFLPDLTALRFWSHPRNLLANMERQQGVLWKRRDIMKLRWRPRWFVLRPSQGVLTYYLLTDPTSDRIVSLAPMAYGTAVGNPVLGPSVSNGGVSSATTTRNRTASSDSRDASQNSVDYDVMPRGTIYLQGCTVQANEKLTKQAESLYAFTIRPPSATEVSIHLAAQTAESRNAWVEKIAQVCRVMQDDAPNTATSNDAETTTTTTTPPRQPQSRATSHHSPGSGEEGASPSAAERCESFPEPENNACNVNGCSTTSQTPPSGTASRAENGEISAAATTGERSDAPQNQKQNADAADSAQQGSAAESWTGLSSDASLFDNVPESLAEQIQFSLRTNLDLCTETPSVQRGWKVLFENRGGHHTAHLKQQHRGANGTGNSRPAVLRNSSILNHSPKHVFSLLADISRRREYETNVRFSERHKTLNPHCFLDYYVYNEVWPTAAREFAVVVHWQVVEKKKEGGVGGDSGTRAIAVTAFSCREADERKPLEPTNVRGVLHGSFYLLEGIGGDADDCGRCKLTRILSFDSAGGLPQRFGTMVLTQQASLPAAMADYLKRNEPITPERLLGPLTNETIAADVIGRLSPPNLSSPKRCLSKNALGEQEADDSSKPRIEAKTEEAIPPLETQAVLLLGPVVLYVITASLPGAAALFCVAVFVAVRQVALLHLGKIVSINGTNMLVGPVTCRFTVDLKGVLRFISNHKEEREELGQGTADVSVVHIVASAVARALKKEERLCRRRVRIPWLLIDELVEAPSDPVDVSVAYKDGGVMTVSGADELSVQTIADRLASSETVKSTIGQCLVLASPNYDESEMDVDALPAAHYSELAILAIVGGVRLERNKRSGPGHSTANGHNAAPRPLLSLSLTINGPLRPSDVNVCHKYAEEVQKLLQFPEMCDNS